MLAVSLSAHDSKATSVMIASERRGRESHGVGGCGCVRATSAALPWLISFNARQQVFFQPGPALLEPFNFRLMTSFRLVTD